MVFQKNKLQEYLNIISKLKLKDSFGVALEGATLQLNGNIRFTIKGNLAFVVREDKKSRDSEYIIICPHINKETGRIINTFFIQYFVSTPEKSLSDRLIFPERTLDSSFKIFIEGFDLMLLFTQSRLGFGFSLYILYMPLGLEVKSLILCSGENCCLSASSAFYHLLLCL